jgi:hypothetical protein
LEWVYCVRMEPNAPKYKERKTCLEYATKNGFRTSASMEPMLDTPNIQSLIKDLEPLVNEDIWLGTMQHISWIKKGADGKLIGMLNVIKSRQTPETLGPKYL